MSALSNSVRIASVRCCSESVLSLIIFCRWSRYRFRIGLIFQALAESGRLEEFFDLAQGYFTRAIEQRLKESKQISKLSQRELRVRAIALSGSLLSLLRWWMDRGAKESPGELDAIFHRMVWEGVGV